MSPYAFGKARQASAASPSFSKEYAYTGLPPATSMHALAVSGVKKFDFSGFAIAVWTERRLLKLAGEKAAAGEKETKDKAKMAFGTIRII